MMNKYRFGKKLVTLQNFLLKPMYTNSEAVKVLDFWVFYTIPLQLQIGTNQYQI